MKTVKGYVLTNYTMGCTDCDSGKVGCFIFDLEHYRTTGKFKALTPVYPDLVEFFANTKSEDRQSCYVEREV